MLSVSVKPAGKLKTEAMDKQIRMRHQPCQGIDGFNMLQPTPLQKCWQCDDAMPCSGLRVEATLEATESGASYLWISGESMPV